MRHGLKLVLLTVGALALVRFSGPLVACPNCGSSMLSTLSEEMARVDVVVLARLSQSAKDAAADPNLPPTQDAAPDASASAGSLTTPPATLPDVVEAAFEIIEVLKGQAVLGETKELQTLYFGNQPAETTFLVTAVDPTNLSWSTPTALSARGVEYVRGLGKQVDAGSERLVYFQEFFEDADRMVANDAYEEYARAPYAEFQLVKDRMPRTNLLKWISDPQIPSIHRRLYLMMLSVCGQPEDVAVLEGLIRQEDRQMRSALDAMLSCYINLRGAEGLPLAEELFLKNPKAEYTDIYAAIMAIRFQAQESQVVPKDRLMQALRHVLDDPRMADLVIPDLARWQDWSVMEKLVDLFKNANADSSWVRVPVVNYLRACPDPKAKAYLEELALIDPDAIKRATQFFPLGAGAKPAAAGVADSTTTPDGPSDAAELDASAGDPAASETVDSDTVDSDVLGSDTSEGSPLNAADVSSEPAVSPANAAEPEATSSEPTESAGADASGTNSTPASGSVKQPAGGPESSPSAIATEYSTAPFVPNESSQPSNTESVTTNAKPLTGKPSTPYTILGLPASAFVGGALAAAVLLIWLVLANRGRPTA